MEALGAGSFGDQSRAEGVLLALLQGSESGQELCKNFIWGWGCEEVAASICSNPQHTEVLKFGTTPERTWGESLIYDEFYCPRKTHIHLAHY